MAIRGHSKSRVLIVWDILPHIKCSPFLHAFLRSVLSTDWHPKLNPSNPGFCPHTNPGLRVWKRAGYPGFRVPGYPGCIRIPSGHCQAFLVSAISRFRIAYTCACAYCCNITVFIHCSFCANKWWWWWWWQRRRCYGLSKSTIYRWLWVTYESISATIAVHVETLSLQTTNWLVPTCIHRLSPVKNHWRHDLSVSSLYHCFHTINIPQRSWWGSGMLNWGNWVTDWVGGWLFRMIFFANAMSQELQQIWNWNFACKYVAKGWCPFCFEGRGATFKVATRSDVKKMGPHVTGSR